MLIVPMLLAAGFGNYLFGGPPTAGRIGEDATISCYLSHYHTCLHDLDCTPAFFRDGIELSPRISRYSFDMISGSSGFMSTNISN